MRFKKWPQLPGAGRTRAGHHHWSHMLTSPEAVLLGKMAYHTKQIRRQCTTTKFFVKSLKQSKNSFVWNLLHKFIFFVSQIVCKLGKKYMVCNKKNSRNPLSRNLAISKKILLKQFREKKTTTIPRSVFCLFFMGYEAYRHQ